MESIKVRFSLIFCRSLVMDAVNLEEVVNEQDSLCVPKDESHDITGRGSHLGLLVG